MFVMYSKNISTVIQPVSDFPIPQPGGAALTRAAIILSYLNIVEQEAYLPNKFVTVSLLVCSSYTFCRMLQ